MKRVCQTILIRNGEAVKGLRFAADRKVGSVLQAVKVAQLREIDELVLLDVTPGPYMREECDPDAEPRYEVFDELLAEVRSPCAVGGAVHSVRHATGLFRAGADKVVVNSSLRLIGEIAGKYGSQAVVVSVDVQHGRVRHRRSPLGEDPCAWAIDCVKAGAGEILLQSVDRDGCMVGMDHDLIRSVCAAVSVPVIASGGCKDYEDMHLAFQAGASAVSCGALWLFEEATPREAKTYLAKKGWSVRL